jgi:transcriptional regulator with XRE-family HTH domain
MPDRYALELKKLGKRIRELREAKGMLQVDLELDTGINRTEISRIENGLRNIEFNTLVKIAEGLEVEVIELFKKK